MFLILLFTLFSVFVRGYQFGVGNQIHYLVYANHQINPALYKTDYLLQTHKLSFTVFPGFIKVISVNYIFTAYILALYFFYLMIFKIGESLGFDKKTAWLSLFLLIYPTPIGASSITSVESSLIPRFMGDVFLLITMYLLFKKKFALSLLPAAIGFLFHAPTLLPYPVILSFLALRGYFKPPKITLWLLPLSLLFLPLVLARSQNPLFIDPVWREILVSRMSYIFALKWSWLWLAITGLIPVFFICAKIIIREKIHPVVIAAVFASFMLFLANIVSDLLSFHPGLELQSTRNLYLAVIFTVLYFAKIITSKFRGPAYVQAFLILFLVSILLPVKNRLDEDVYAFKRPAGYEQIAVWSKTHTPADSLFLVPPEISGFRYLSQRSVVVEHKEGGDSLYSRSLALEWSRRQRLLKNYYNLDTSEIDKLKQEFGMNYLVTTEVLPYPALFSSHNWKIYNL